MVKWRNGEIMIWWSGDMVGWLECVNMVSGWNGTFFSFSKWWNGEIIIWCNGGTVKFSNDESILGTHFHWWQNDEMMKKLNSAMSCMVIFNCWISYQLRFSLLDFFLARQLWPYWQVWGNSLVLYLVSDGLSHILTCHLSVLSHGEVV